MGRSSKYETHIKPHFAEIKAGLEKGLTEKELAKECGISESTWHDYKLRFSEFSELIKSADKKPLIAELDNALIKAALGFTYQEKKQTISEKDGVREAKTEIIERFCPPNVSAIYGALNRHDPDYKKDAAYYELKRQELEIKKKLAENDSWIDI